MVRVTLAMEVRELLHTLANGGVLRRRGMTSAAPDQDYWLGANSRAYTESRRMVADHLVTTGKAEWHEYSEEDSRRYLATHELRLTPEAQP